MPLVNRKDLPGIIREIKKGTILPVYLVFGDRYLCQTVLHELTEALLPDATTRSQQLMAIDGDVEDPTQTLNVLRTYSLFATRQVVRVTDSRLFHSKNVAAEIWLRAEKSFHNGRIDQAAKYAGQILALLPDTDAGWDTLASLADSKWKSLLGFPRPDSTDWLTALPAPTGGRQAAKKNPADLYIDALAAGLPAEHILLLASESVDKRKKLFTTIKDCGVVIDAAVDTGLSTAARKDQDAVLIELIRQTLAEFGKKIQPAAQLELLKRAGFHPVAVVREVEKLALFADERAEITLADVRQMTGRTKEDALFELNEALFEKNRDEALTILQRLQEDNTHPLAIIAGLRNHLHKLLLIRSLQDAPSPRYTPGMPYPVFQKTYAPQLKEAKKDAVASLPAHPYALYRLFAQAAGFTPAALIAGLKALLNTEYALKSSFLSPHLLLDALTFALLVP